MIRYLLFFAIFILLNAAAAAMPAFPGAEGAGAESKGGRGGLVMTVNTIEDYKPGSTPIAGSFRQAVENATGPRIVVFSVSGRIELKGRIRIENPYITIAGQTAPGDGICLSHYGMQIFTHDVIIRCIRVRPSDVIGQQAIAGGAAGWEVDAMSVGAGSANVILDHCSMSWSNDEVCSVSGEGIDKVTVQWCFITESLINSTHEKGAHGYGSLIRTNGRVTYHHNLWAFHSSRCPRPGTYPDSATLDESILFDCRNNLMYKGGKGYSAADPVRMNFVRNHNEDTPFSATTSCYYFAEANKGAISGGNAMTVPYNVNIVPVTTDPAEAARSRILDSAGSICPKRDSTDRRIVKSILTGGGRLIDSHLDVGEWDLYKSTPAPVDADCDGMPDAWEASHGLLPGNDANGTALSRDGYTNIEVYINGLLDFSTSTAISVSPPIKTLKSAGVNHLSPEIWYTVLGQKLAPKNPVDFSASFPAFSQDARKAQFLLK